MFRSRVEFNFKNELGKVVTFKDCAELFSKTFSILYQTEQKHRPTVQEDRKDGLDSTDEEDPSFLLMIHDKIEQSIKNDSSEQLSQLFPLIISMLHFYLYKTLEKLPRARNRRSQKGFKNIKRTILRDSSIDLGDGQFFFENYFAIFDSKNYPKYSELDDSIKLFMFRLNNLTRKNICSTVDDADSFVCTHIDFGVLINQFQEKLHTLEEEMVPEREFDPSYDFSRNQPFIYLQLFELAKYTLRYIHYLDENSIPRYFKLLQPSDLLSLPSTLGTDTTTSALSSPRSSISDPEQKDERRSQEIEEARSANASGVPAVDASDSRTSYIPSFPIAWSMFSGEQEKRGSRDEESEESWDIMSFFKT